MPSGTIWIDITELFGQLAFTRQPTGIARTIISLTDALAAEPGSRFAAARPLFWHPILGRAMTGDDPRLSPLAGLFPQLNAWRATAGLARSASSKLTKAIATSLPRPVRYALFPADNGVVAFERCARRQGIALVPAKFERDDALFVPGSFWLGKYMPSLLARARAAHIPITAFVHDVLLLSHPEWLGSGHSEQFRRGCDLFLPACAAIVCNSHNTREELRRFVALPESLPIHTCRLGDQIFGAPSTDPPAEISDLLGKRYALFVATIIPRKNHRLLVEAWRLLWRELGQSTPYLLFVGGGAPDAALAAAMEQEKVEGGRVIWLRSIDDGSLDALYDRAWITLYPSLGEGYGMPIAEALSRGKVCLAPLRGGIRDVSTDLIDDIDPLDPQSVVAKVKMYLAQPSRLLEREAEIRRRYRPTAWSETAQTVRSVLESTVAPRRSGDRNAAA